MTPCFYQHLFNDRNKTAFFVYEGDLLALESNIARSINYGSVGIILVHCVIRYEKRNFYNFTKIFIKILNYEIVKAAVGTIVTYLRYIKLLHGENYMINTKTQRRLGC